MTMGAAQSFERKIAFRIEKLTIILIRNYDQKKEPQKRDQEALNFLTHKKNYTIQ